MASTGARRLPERVEQGDVIEIRGRLPETLRLRVISEPSFEYVGFFHEGVMERVRGDPWMCAAVTGESDSLVYVLGGDRRAFVAFGEPAASAGAVHSTSLDGIEVR